MYFMVFTHVMNAFILKEVKIMADRFAAMYNVNLSIVLNRDKYITVSGSDIVSISFINNYDTMTYPIIRIRIYSDLSLIQSMLEFPDAIYVRLRMDGNVYKINDDETSPIPVSAATSINFELKGYIENKNIPTSVMDQYEDGIKKTSDLNDNVKSPIEIYCYDEQLLHMMKQRCLSIYKNMSLESMMIDMFNRNNIRNIKMDIVSNQTKYDQILIPNLDVTDTMSFLDINYGLYPKGGTMFGDYDGLYISNLDVNRGGLIQPIYVKGYKSSSDMTGLINTGQVHQYRMVTNTPNVSIMTETDIERVINAPEMASIHLNNLNIDIEELKKIFTESIEKSTSRKVSDGITLHHIDTPQLLYKQTSPYVLSSYIARLNEKITRVDVSGSGYDIGSIHVNTRFNLIFESPIRGMNMNTAYRPTYVCHVLSNMNGGLFIAQTTMNLVSN